MWNERDGNRTFISAWAQQNWNCCTWTTPFERRGRSTICNTGRDSKSCELSCRWDEGPIPRQLKGVAHITDRGMQRLGDVPRLHRLYLQGLDVGDTGLSSLGKLTALRYLEVYNLKINGNCLANLKTSNDLRTLKLGGGTITAANLEHLKRLANLEELSLTPVDDVGLGHLAGMSNLKRLTIVAGNVTDAGLKHVAGIASLESLRIWHTDIHGIGLASLATMKKLTDLDVRDNLHAVPDEVGRGLSELRNLRQLRVGSGVFGDWGNQKSDRYGDRFLGQISGLTQLEALDLYNCSEISDDGLKQLERFNQLQKLRLGNTHVTDVGLPHLAVLTKLTELGLSSLRVTDQGITHLATLRDLKKVNLSGTTVSASGLKFVLDSFPALQDVEINPTDSKTASEGKGVTQDEIEHFRGELENRHRK